MTRMNRSEVEATLERLRSQARAENIRLTQHTQQAMVEEEISLDDVLAAIENSQILEDYPEHRRGPCCLLSGFTQAGRPIHVVAATALPTLVLITVYQPKPPRWVTPTKRKQGL